MSDTPRTDAEEFPEAISKNPVVPVEFARTLERENAALRSSIERLIRYFCTRPGDIHVGARFPVKMNTYQRCAFELAKKLIK